MRTRRVTAALDAASLPVLPLLLQYSDGVGEEERHILHELLLLHLVHGLIHVGLLSGPRKCQHVSGTILRFLHYQVPRITSTGGITGQVIAPHLGFPLEVGVVGSSSQARFPEGSDSAAAANQPSPDKSRTMHHV